MFASQNISCESETLAILHSRVGVKSETNDAEFTRHRVGAAGPLTLELSAVRQNSIAFPIWFAFLRSYRQ